jgi:hypothetical protein
MSVRKTKREPDKKKREKVSNKSFQVFNEEKEEIRKQKLKRKEKFNVDIKKEFFSKFFFPIHKFCVYEVKDSN